MFSKPLAAGTRFTSGEMVAPADSNWTGLIVFDCNQAGVVIDTATPTRNLYSPGDGDGNPPEAMGTMMPLYAPYHHADGFYVGDLQINGVRALDPAVGTWTTPDAYEGDIHDPMSQQKYMFNRNNGIDYSDGTGRGKKNEIWIPDRFP